MSQLTKKYAFLALILSSSLQAKTVYYGDNFKTVKINDKDETLLSFVAAPTTTNCLPSGVFSFESLSSQSISRSEATIVKLSQYSSSRNDPGKKAPELPRSLKKILRVSPIKKGTSKCTISLRSGDRVGVILKTSKDTVEPLFSFEPVGSFEADSQKTIDLHLELLRSLLKGVPIKSLEPIPMPNSKLDRNTSYKFETKEAYYKVSYAATNSASVSLWKVKGETKKKVSWPKLLSSKSNSLLYAAIMPQKNVYSKGEDFTLYVSSRADLLPEDLGEALR